MSVLDFRFFASFSSIEELLCWQLTSCWRGQRLNLFSTRIQSRFQMPDDPRYGCRALRSECKRRSLQSQPSPVNAGKLQVSTGKNGHCVAWRVMVNTYNFYYYCFKIISSFNMYRRQKSQWWIAEMRSPLNWIWMKWWLPISFSWPRHMWVYVLTISSKFSSSQINLPTDTVWQCQCSHWAGY